MSLGDRLRLEGKLVGVAEGERLGIAKGEQVGIAKGERIGIAKGERVGRAEGRAEDAIRMIRRDLDDDFIEEITELSADEIKHLRTTYNGGIGT